jgi:hypothetical protein
MEVNTNAPAHGMYNRSALSVEPHGPPKNFTTVSNAVLDGL